MIHTTANHPWLTADRGRLVAGALRVGEPVRLLDGGVATVVGLQALPGVGPMWDLSLDATHTFAVGISQAVVHNTGPCDPVALNTTERPVYLHRVSPYGNRALGMSQQQVIKDILDNQQLLGSNALHGEGVWAYQLGPKTSLGSIGWPHQPLADNEILFTTDAQFIPKGGVQIDPTGGGDTEWGGPWQAKEGHFDVEAGTYLPIQIIAGPGGAWPN